MKQLTFLSSVLLDFLSPFLNQNFIIMKKYLFFLLLIAISINCSAQTSQKKIDFYGGFGFQQYNGDLGNGFYKFNSTEYGVGSLTLDYSLNKFFDIKFFTTFGDLGYCQVNDHEANHFEEHHGHDHHHENEDKENEGHGINPKTENLNSFMFSGNLALQIDFANGYIFSESSKFQPFVYFGIGLNRITDRMKMECVVPGFYTSINMGTGFKYYLSESIFAGYSLNFGVFTSDKLDFFDQGKNDRFMQNSATIGYSF